MIGRIGTGMAVGLLAVTGAIMLIPGNPPTDEPPPRMIDQVCLANPETPSPVDAESLTRWAENAVRQLHTFEAEAFNTYVAGLEVHFTPVAYERWLKEMEEQDRAFRIVSTGASEKLTVLRPAQIVAQGSLGELYIWWVEMPVQIVRQREGEDDRTRMHTLRLTAMLYPKTNQHSAVGMHVIDYADFDDTTWQPCPGGLSPPA